MRPSPLSPHDNGPSRRRAGLMLAGAVVLPAAVLRPAHATSAAMQAAIQAWAGSASAAASIRDGRVELDVPPLVDNGNLVSITVRMTSPMTATDHVREIAVFNDGNPQPEVARFEFSLRSGRAQAALNIRLATTQNLVAVARLSDGSLWQQRAEVVVVLAACIE
jgi:sulfur-oxidizing protein SoxY